MGPKRRYIAQLLLDAIDEEWDEDPAGAATDPIVGSLNGLLIAIAMMRDRAFEAVPVRLKAQRAHKAWIDALRAAQAQKLRSLPDRALLEEQDKAISEADHELLFYVNRLLPEKIDRLRAALRPLPMADIEIVYWLERQVMMGALQVRMGHSAEEMAEALVAAQPPPLQEKLTANIGLVARAIAGKAAVKLGRRRKGTVEPDAEAPMGRLLAALGMNISANARKSNARRLRQRKRIP